MRSIEVWYDNSSEWVNYTIDEIDDYFEFVHKPDWTKVSVIYVHDAGLSKWMEIYFKGGYTKVYNSIFGTYAE